MKICSYKEEQKCFGKIPDCEYLIFNLYFDYLVTIWK